MNIISLRFAVVAMMALLAVSAASLPDAAAHAQSAPAAGAELEVLQIRPNFYMIAGAGGNVAVQVGGDGVVLVDTGSREHLSALAAAVGKITTAPIRFIINTSADPDHVGGNEGFLQSGVDAFQPLLNLFPRNYFVSGPVAILAAEGVLRRMSAPSGLVSPFPVAAWPTETFETGRRYVYLNGEGVEVLHQPAAHTDGDSVVFFRRSDVLVAGDIFDMTRFPVIDLQRGGSLQGSIDALNRMIAIAIPSVPDVSREVGTTVVAGHGQLGDQFDLLNYRDMLVIVRDHVQDLVKAGRTLEQIKAASPAKGFMRRFGSDSGAWTTNDFIESVYQSLMKGKA